MRGEMRGTTIAVWHIVNVAVLLLMLMLMLLLLLLPAGKCRLVHDTTI